MSSPINSDSNLKKNVLVFGATGLVGKQLIEQLVANEHINQIGILNRKEQNYNSRKVTQELVIYSQLEDYAHLFDVDQVYICLGTTIKKAGSKSNFEEVDLILPTRIAKLAKEKAVEKLIMISSMGANENSSNFYLKTKAKAEYQISSLEIPNTYFVRPSLLLGDRKEKRVGEAIAKAFMNIFSFALIGPFKRYKAIKDIEVAKAMIKIMFSNESKKIFENDELLLLGA